jgi:hypothetical protein
MDETIPFPNHPRSSSPLSRLPAEDAARAFLERHFPKCIAAFLAGSASRGETTSTSDLDLLIVDRGEAEPRWATFRESGWPIEAFILTPETYSSAFADQAKKRWALLPTLCRDGITLRDEEGLARRMKEEATVILARGPELWSAAEMNQCRFHLTDLLQDLEMAADLSELLLAAGGVFHLTATLLLAHHGQWLGQGKWLLRQLRQTAPQHALLLEQALETLCHTRNPSPLIETSDAVLELVGGRRFEGQSGSIQP